MATFLFIFIVGAAIVLFLLGPKTHIDFTIKALELPEDLDQYLQESEAQFSDIVPKTEKKIIWADPENKAKTPLSIVYIHGFSATRQEVAPLCDILAEKLEANLFYTRLTGHGRTGEAMGEATVNDWLNDTVEALEIGKKLGEKVLIVGVSTGCTLATWLAAHRKPQEVLAYILISPNYMPYNSSTKLLTLPWARVIIPKIFGDTHSWDPFNEQHGQYWVTSHPLEPVFQMMALVKMVRNSDLESIQTPVHVFYSTQDRVVNPKETEKISARIGSPAKKILTIEDAGDPVNHVLAGDILSPNTTEPTVLKILDFVEPLLA